MEEVNIDEVGNKFTDMEGQGSTGLATTPLTYLQTQNTTKCWRLWIINRLGLIKSPLIWAKMSVLAQFRLSVGIKPGFVPTSISKVKIKVTRWGLVKAMHSLEP
jgi:hypothetical protein